MSLLAPHVPADFSPRLGLSPPSPHTPLSPLPSPSLLTTYAQSYPLSHPSDSSPRITIPHLSYPHLLAEILSHSDPQTLLSFRATSSYFKTWIDGALARHLVFGRRSARAAAVRGSLAVTSAGEKEVGVGFFKACGPPDRAESPCAMIRVPCRPSLGALSGEPRPRQRRPSSAASTRPVTPKPGDDERACPSDQRGRKRKIGRGLQDDKAYARAIVSRCRVLDLVGGVPCSGLLPLLSSLGSVHTVRLRSDPRQYPYSEIGARRRVTFSRALGSASGGLFAPVVLVEDCLRGTEEQVLTVQYDPRHPHLPRMTVQRFALGPRLRTLTVIFTPVREKVEGTVYKTTPVPGFFKELVGPALACLEQGILMRIVGLEDMPAAVFGLGEEEARETAFRMAIAEGWAGAHRQVRRDEALVVGWELAQRVLIKSAAEYRDEIGEGEWAIEAEEESWALAPRF